MSWLQKLFGNPPKTAQVAKERLQLIIAHERDGPGSSTANFLPDLQRELIAVISKYVKVNPKTSASRWKSRAITRFSKSISSFPKRAETNSIGALRHEEAPMPSLLKPSEIVARLSEHVIGQDAAKKTLAVAIYAHFRRQAASTVDSVELSKSNILLIGPTGTGKTLLCETLARILELPFVTADATSLAQTQFVGDEIEAILHRLLDRADGDLARAQRGIVFIDEIDKLKAIGGPARATSGESVQHALLKIMEGAPVRLRDGRHIDTTQILFICGGAFVGLEQILDRTHGFGFISAAGDDDRQILERLNARIKPTDLLEFGLIPNSPAACRSSAVCTI
jgi:endopeptidase Clp ATP-binding regulatory subunit ClpX/cell division topological specificity factor MinE